MAYAGEKILRGFGADITVFDTVDVEVSLGNLRAQLDVMIAQYGADKIIEKVEVYHRGVDEPEVSQEFRIRL
jgi:hypothetical protein